MRILLSFLFLVLFALSSSLYANVEQQMAAVCGGGVKPLLSGCYQRCEIQCQAYYSQNMAACMQACNDDCNEAAQSAYQRCGGCMRRRAACEQRATNKEELMACPGEYAQCLGRIDVTVNLEIPTDMPSAPLAKPAPEAVQPTGQTPQRRRPRVIRKGNVNIIEGGS